MDQELIARMAVEQIGVAFHGIGNCSREMEPGEQRYWITKDSFLRVLDIVASLPDPSRVLLTFDDGNASDHDIDLPALRDRRLTGSFFVITSRIDREGYLSSSQLRDLLLSGMTVGSHGVEHIDWRKVDRQRLHDELSISKGTIEDIIGRTISTASIPFGRYNRRVLSALRAAGYKKVFSTDGGTSALDAFLVGRWNIRADMSDAGYARLLTDRETPLSRVTRMLKMLRRNFT